MIGMVGVKKVPINSKYSFNLKLSESRQLESVGRLRLRLGLLPLATIILLVFIRTSTLGITTERHVETCALVIKSNH